MEDDTQIGGDHVDYHRSPLVIASPWVRHAGTSSDFSGPDRAPGLGAMLAAQRSGVITPELRAMLDSDEAIDEARAEDMDARLDEDDDLERQVYDREVAEMRAWLEAHPEVRTDWAEMQRPR